MDYSLSDLAAIFKGGENGGGLLTLVIVFLFVIMLGGGFGGNRNPGPAPDYVTQAEFQQGLANQQTQAQLSQIALSSADNNYQTARLISEQTSAIMQQNNANQTNAIQAYNQIQLAITNQTNVFAQQLQALQAKVDTCCCEIKTQMLQNRLADAEAALVAEKGKVSNFEQSQYILGQMGKWVANPAAAST